MEEQEGARGGGGFATGSDHSNAVFRKVHSKGEFIQEGEL